MNDCCGLFICQQQKHVKYGVYGLALLVDIFSPVSQIQPITYPRICEGHIAGYLKIGYVYVLNKFQMKVGTVLEYEREEQIK